MLKKKLSDAHFSMTLLPSTTGGAIKNEVVSDQAVGPVVEVELRSVLIPQGPSGANDMLTLAGTGLVLHS
jgi:hypothetical protein